MFNNLENISSYSTCPPIMQHHLKYANVRMEFGVMPGCYQVLWPPKLRYIVI